MASSGGLPPPCSILTAPCSSETAVPHRARRSRPCWRTCFCITRSTRGWAGSSRRYRSNATPTTAWCTASADAKRSTPAGRSGTGWPRSGCGCIPTRPRVVYCKDGSRRGSWEHTSFTFLGYTFRARAARGPRGERVRRVPPGDQQGGLETAQPHRAQVAAAPAHRAEPRRARRDDQPGRPRMDAVLRRVLPLRVVHAPGAHQHLPWCAGPARSTDGYVPTGRPAQPGTASPCSSPATSPTGRGSGTP
jgi:hypothetical protein